MMKNIFHYSVYPALLFAALVPYMASAQGINLSYVMLYSNSFIYFINAVLVPVLFAIAFLYFVYGVYKYFILGAENDKERETGRDFVLWSLVGFAVILSVWGLVNVLVNTFNIPTGGVPPRYPTL